MEKAKWRYDVFLSFRIKDTRDSFTGNLYNALRNARISTFMEDCELKGGDRITPTIFRAIEASRISIVVFSQNYAHSSWCLYDLVKINECRKAFGQVVLPIFYDVDPSDVRLQRGTFGEAMDVHDYRFRSDLERIQEWRSVLYQIACLSGYSFRIGDRYEYELIEDIVEWVTRTVSRFGIFLSYSQEDTGYSFTGFLNNALSRSGFQTFMVGDQISQSTIPAIESSRLSIIVFSPNYARSSSCLDELLTILERMKVKNQLVWPIFYKVEPSDVRHQKNSYGEAMTEHENMLGSGCEKVRQWRSALLQVANLKGWHLKIGYDYELIEKIVELAIKISNGL
ncbi:hypothetical protein Fmac_030643 [Flemingia macrophylla]|uniref:TIR domain-containing protein n=1 Tax=Flemingia macrophylla TaxID=520843 RepID=A0ABD1KZS0_9FABA